MEKDKNIEKKGTWGKVALTLSFIGLFVAFLPSIMEVVNPAPPPPPIEDTIVDTAKSMVDKIKGVEKSTPPSSYTDRENLIRNSLHGSLALAGLAFILAMISFVSQENKRFMQSTVAVSAVVVGYNFMWIAVGIVIMAIIVYAAKDLLDLF